MEKYNLGIVLSGGGARGIAHLGVLKALEEIGVKPDVISGTSAGAIVGSFYASGHKPEEILDIVLNTTLFSSLRPALGRGFLRMDRAELIYKKHLAPATFENLKTPLYISATNIINGEAVYFNEGDLILPIMAASSIPIIFQPVKMDDMLLLDGGIIDNLPVTPLLGKCNKIIGVSVNHINKDDNINNFKKVIERSMDIVVVNNVKDSASKCDFMIEPKELMYYSIFDIGRAQDIFNVGYQHTLAISKEIEDFCSQEESSNIKY